MDAAHYSKPYQSRDITKKQIKIKIQNQCRVYRYIFQINIFFYRKHKRTDGHFKVRATPLTDVGYRPNSTATGGTLPPTPGAGAGLIRSPINYKSKVMIVLKID